MPAAHGEVKEVGEGYLLPLSKPGKQKTAESTRPLALLSTCRKVLTSTVLRRVEGAVSEYLPSRQHAPRKKRSTPEATWTAQALRATVGRYTEQYQYLATDTPKASGSVTGVKLLEVTEGSRLADEDSLRVTQYLVSGATLKARVAREVGETLGAVSGTPQGGALSPTLLAAYLEWVMGMRRESHPSRGAVEDFTLQHADDTKVLFHSRDTQQAWGPHAETCVCEVRGRKSR